MIKDLSSRRSFERKGKVHLGYKKNGKAYSVDYFVFPEDADVCKSVLGENPNKITIQFPYSDWMSNVPQFRKMYGNSKLLCRGDGDTASWYGEAKNVPDDVDIQKKIESGVEYYAIKCPGDKCVYSNDEIDSSGKRRQKRCSPVMNLVFRIPSIEKVDGVIGIWQLDTKSINSIIKLNSSLELFSNILKSKGIAFDEALFDLSVQFETSKTKSSFKFPVLSIAINEKTLSSVPTSDNVSQAEDAVPNLLLTDSISLPGGITVSDPYDTIDAAFMQDMWGKAIEIANELEISVTRESLRSAIESALADSSLGKTRVQDLCIMDASYITSFLKTIIKAHIGK